MYLMAEVKLRTSKRKRDVLNYAMREYANLLTWLLDWARAEINRLPVDAAFQTKSGKIIFPTQRIQRLLPPLSKCPGEIHSSLKDAARADIAAMLAGYFTLDAEGYAPGFPGVRSDRPDLYLEALENLMLAGCPGEDEWRNLTAELLRKSKLLPPALQFPRMDGARQARNAAFLVDPDTNRYFVVLYLLPHQHHLCERIETRGNLQEVGVKENPHRFDSRSQTAIIFPVECGQWHEKRFFADGVPKAARLYCDSDGDYYFLISFEMPEVEPVTLTGSVMSVISSYIGFVAYAIADPTGKIVLSGDYRESATELRTLKSDWARAAKRRQRRGLSTEGFALRKTTKHTLHAIVNDLADKAVAHGARIVIESPKKAKKAKNTSTTKNHSRPLPVAQMASILEYKLALAGLPFPRWAKAWLRGDDQDKWIHKGRICALCGSVRPKPQKGEKPQPTFVCAGCGRERDYGINLAEITAIQSL